MKGIADQIIAERTVLSVILLNALTLFLVGFTVPESAERSTLFWVDYGCVVFFVLEACLKLNRNGWKGYWGDGWNRFDFVIVVLSLPVLASPFMDIHVFGVVLVLRLGRLFRLFRLLRFIPNRDHLAKGMKRALRASVGVLLALFLMNFILAIGATTLFQDRDPEHFGNPFLSCYSLFKVCTVEGWYEIPDGMAERTGSAFWGVLARLYFVGSVLVMGILGLSLANAIFIDEMTTDNTEALEDKVDALSAQIQSLRDELRSGEKSSSG